MTRNEFNLLYAVKKSGLLSCRKLSGIAGVSIGYASQTLKRFTERGWTDETGITKAGLDALQPYKAENAIIMAAGMSTRFVPLSLEKPKGLLTVKGEVLIERQIEQLQAAGINNIILVLGYKKEAFFYLENKYDRLTIVINPEYNTKNNTYTLYLAQQFIGNSYICSSDNYFAENPFDEYVYQAYYSAVHVTERTNEWYMFPDAKGNIARVQKSGAEGDIMLGHAYWDRPFSAAFLELLNRDRAVGNYDSTLWEQILADNLKLLPPMEIKVYPDGVIFEFDSLDELRSFDSDYVEHTNSKIMKNIAEALACRESDIQSFQMIKKGLTNTSFLFEVGGTQYVYRHSGDGKGATISRGQEKRALELARECGADPTYLFMDENEGWKISRYVPDARVPDYGSEEDSQRVLAVLRRLHGAGLQAERAFRPFEEACRTEETLRTEKQGIADREFGLLKGRVQRCLQECKDDGVEPCFCHCDTYNRNWLLTEDGQTILIDWEYAGQADPGCDLGAYIMDAGWEIPEAERFIAGYCGDEYSEKLRFHYLAYTAAVSFYWYVWALYREACGDVMGESLYRWRVMAQKYSNYLVTYYQLKD